MPTPIHSNFHTYSSFPLAASSSTRSFQASPLAPGTMRQRGLCKFYARGNCLKGESCDFVHNWKISSQPKACMYYQRGTCTFGSRCRFQHVISSQSDPSALFSSCDRGLTNLNPSRVCNSSGASSSKTVQNPNISAALPGLSRVTTLNPDDHNGQATTEGLGIDRVICSLAADGNCPHGERCPNIHGDLCSTCGKYCLHPINMEDRGKHADECQKKQQALQRSQEIECSVCLERVLFKQKAAERKFGLLAECDHAFCITCIKKWRRSSSSPEMEFNGEARACPVCRRLSYYVIPSLIWYSSKEEKIEIISKYKEKLKSIDCKYFNFGSGFCRFGSRCFYKHEAKPGASRHKRSSNANYRCNNRQHTSRWDGGSFGFEEFADMANFDAMLEMFEDLYLPDTESIDDGESGILDVLMKLDELEMKYSGDYDEEDLLEPWEREMLYYQLGYDTDAYQYESESDDEY